jgi:hypothetical protein
MVRTHEHSDWLTAIAKVLELTEIERRLARLEDRV